MDIIERIKQELLIPDILPEVQGQKVIQCPFPDHEDQTPSFHYFADKNCFYCFGCRRGGSILDLLIHLHGWSLCEAINYGKQRLGISDSELTAEEVSRHEKLHQREEILKKITEHCFEALWSGKGHPEVAKARKYLKDRGWSEDLLKSMRIGLIDIKEVCKICTKEDLELAGLLVKGKSNKLHPLISTPRIWYPVISRHKIVYGICGRFLEDDPQADKKYINMVSGPLGVGAGHYLYNQDAINRKVVYICEGISDTISAVHLGLDAVGVLGVSMRINPALFK